MKLLCTSCQLLKEPREEREEKSPLPFVCSDCRAKSAETKRAETSKAQPAPKVVEPPPQLDFDDDPLDAPASSEGEPLSLREVEIVSSSRGAKISQSSASPVSSEGEPVSLRDLEIVLSPGAAPPPLLTTKEKEKKAAPAAAKAQPPPVPKAKAVEAKAAKAEPAEERDMPDSARAFAIDAPPAFKRASSVRARSLLGDGLSPRPPDSSAEDLVMMAAMNPTAPADAKARRKHVDVEDVFAIPEGSERPPPMTPPKKVEVKPTPPLRARAAPALPLADELDDDPRDPENPASGLVDIRKMVASAEAPPPTTRGSYHEIDTDLFNLSGGLFDDAPIAPVLPLAPPDIVPAAPDSRGRTPLLEPPKLTAASETPNGETAFTAPASARSKVPTPPRRMSTAAPVARSGLPSAPHSKSRSLVWLGVAAVLGVVGTFWFMRQPAPLPAATATPSNEAAHVPPVQTTQAQLTPAKSTVPMKEPSVDDPAPSASSKATATATAVAAVETAKPALTGRLPSTEPTDVYDTPKPPEDKPTPVTKAPEPVTASPMATPPPPPPSGADFDKDAAKAALTAAAGRAAGCRKEGDPAGNAKVSVTFSPSGRAMGPRVDGPPFQGTPTGGCIAQAFRGVSVPPFDGPPVTVSWSVPVH